MREVDTQHVVAPNALTGTHLVLTGEPGRLFGDAKPMPAHHRSHSGGTGSEQGQRLITG